MSIYNLPSFLHSSWKLLLCVCVCVCVCLYIRTHTHTQIGYISTAHKPTRFQKSRPGYRQMLLPVRCSVAMETNHAMFMPVTQFPPVTTPATCIHHHRHHHRGTRILQISRSHPQILRARGVTWKNVHTEVPSSGVTCEPHCYLGILLGACELLRTFTCK